MAKEHGLKSKKLTRNELLKQSRNRRSDEREMVTRRGIFCHFEDASIFVAYGPEIGGRVATKQKVKRALLAVISSIEETGLPEKLVHVYAYSSKPTYH